MATEKKSLSLTSVDADDRATYMDVDHLHYLVKLVDQSDVTELEVSYSTNNTRLVLKKANDSKASILSVGVSSAVQEGKYPDGEKVHETIYSPMVGIFQCWSPSKNKPLVTVGDRIHEGQPIGIVRSLDIPNEVEASLSGEVVAILVPDGQFVEYGQPLMTIATQ